MDGNPNSNSGKPPTGSSYGDDASAAAFGGNQTSSYGDDASAAAFGGNQTYNQTFTFDAPPEETINFASFNQTAASTSSEDNPRKRQRGLPPRIYSGGGSAPFSFGGNQTYNQTFTFDAPPEETINFASFNQSDAAAAAKTEAATTEAATTEAATTEVNLRKRRAAATPGSGGSASTMIQPLIQPVPFLSIKRFMKVEEGKYAWLPKEYSPVPGREVALRKQDGSFQLIETNAGGRSPIIGFLVYGQQLLVSTYLEAKSSSAIVRNIPEGRGPFWRVKGLSKDLRVLLVALQQHVGCSFIMKGKANLSKQELADSFGITKFASAATNTSAGGASSETSTSAGGASASSATNTYAGGASASSATSTSASGASALSATSTPVGSASSAAAMARTSMTRTSTSTPAAAARSTSPAAGRASASPSTVTAGAFAAGASAGGDASASWTSTAGQPHVIDGASSVSAAAASFTLSTGTSAGVASTSTSAGVTLSTSTSAAASTRMCKSTGLDETPKFIVFLPEHLEKILIDITTTKLQQPGKRKELKDALYRLEIASELLPLKAMTAKEALVNFFSADSSNSIRFCVGTFIACCKFVGDSVPTGAAVQRVLGVAQKTVDNSRGFVQAICLSPEAIDAAQRSNIALLGPPGWLGFVSSASGKWPKALVEFANAADIESHVNGILADLQGDINEAQVSSSFSILHQSIPFYAFLLTPTIPLPATISPFSISLTGPTFSSSGRERLTRRTGTPSPPSPSRKVRREGGSRAYDLLFEHLRLP